MGASNHYTQVLLARPYRNGRQLHVAWIPSSFATVGKWIKIDSTGEQSWLVTGRYASVLAEEASDRALDAARWAHGRLGD